MTNSNLRAVFWAVWFCWLLPAAAAAETPEEFAAQCRREIAEIAQKARAALTAGEKAEYSRQALEKALDCVYEGQRRFPDRQDALPPLGRDGYEETAALHSYLYWSQAKNDLDLNLSWDPAERLRHLKERYDLVGRITGIAHSGGFDERSIPQLGKDSGDGRSRRGYINIFGLPFGSVGVRLSRVFAKECERIVRDFKDHIDKESDPAAKSALRQQLIEAVKWCETTAHSAGMDERLAPQLGRDNYRIRDYYIDECLHRLARAKTEAEREQIRKECHKELTENSRGGRLETPIPMSLTPAGVPPAAGRVGDKASGPPSAPTPATTTASSGGCPECESLRAQIKSAEDALIDAKFDIALAEEKLEKLNGRVGSEKGYLKDAKAALDAFDHPGDSAEMDGRKIDAVDREIIDDYLFDANILYRRGDISAAEAAARMKGPSPHEVASLRKERRAPLEHDVAESEEEISRLEWDRRETEKALEAARWRAESAKVLLELLREPYADCLARCRKPADATREAAVPGQSDESSGPTLDDIRKAKRSYTRAPAPRDPAEREPIVDESEDLRDKTKAKTGERMRDAEITKPKPKPKAVATTPSTPTPAADAPSTSTPTQTPPPATATSTPATPGTPIPPTTTMTPTPAPAATGTPPPRPAIETINKETRRCATYFNDKLVYEGECR